MMPATLSAEEIAGLSTALELVFLVGVEVDSESRVAIITLIVPSQTPRGPYPETRKVPRVQIHLSPVGRVCAVYSSASKDIMPLRIDELFSAVDNVGGYLIVRGSINLPFKEPARVSLDSRLGIDGLTYKLSLLHEPRVNARLDLWIWFDEISIRSPQGDVIALGDFIAAGKRWRDSL